METNLILPVQEAVPLETVSKVDTAPQEAVSFEHVLNQECQACDHERREKEEESPEELAIAVVPVVAQPAPEPPVVVQIVDESSDIVEVMPLETAEEPGPIMPATTTADPLDTPQPFQAGVEGGSLTVSEAMDVVAESAEPSIDVDDVGRVQATFVQQAPLEEPDTNPEAPTRAVETPVSVEGFAPPEVEGSSSPSNAESKPVAGTTSTGKPAATGQVDQSVNASPWMSSVDESSLDVVEDMQVDSQDGTPSSEPEITSIVGEAALQGTTDIASMEETEPARLAEAQRPEVLQQVTSGVRILQRSGETSLKIQLHPESLGRIQLQLISEEDGVRVNMIADAESTSSMLQEHSSDLQHSLKHAGVPLLDIAVSHHDQQPSSPYPQNADPDRTHRPDEGEENGNIPVGIFSDPDALVDVRI